MDAPITISLLLLNLLNNLVFASLLNDRRTLLEAFKRVKIGHAFREGNRCADKLAQRGRMLKEPSYTLFELPPAAVFLVNHSQAGKSISRLNSVNFSSCLFYFILFLVKTSCLI